MAIWQVLDHFWQGGFDNLPPLMSEAYAPLVPRVTASTFSQEEVLGGVGTGLRHRHPAAERAAGRRASSPTTLPGREGGPSGRGSECKVVPLGDWI